MISLVFDTETTGIPLHPDADDKLQPRIIEFGGILVDSDGNELDSIEVLIDPQQQIEQIITKITGITNADLRGQPIFIERAPELRPFFAEADALIAHNLPFDYRMVDMELSRNHVRNWPWPELMVCTVQEHSEEWGKFPKLQDLYKYYTGNVLHQTHRALDDVRALVEVAKCAGVLP